MNIEIQEFYWDSNEQFTWNKTAKKKKKGRSGTLHIYITDLDLDIRGIVFIERPKKQWVIRMPHKTAFEDGKRVFYPVLTFVNLDTMKDLLLQIREKGVAYIENKLKQNKA
jgi:hypothetical protein